MGKEEDTDMDRDRQTQTDKGRDEEKGCELNRARGTERTRQSETEIGPSMNLRNRLSE